MKFLYRLYQLVVAAPLIIVATIVTALVTSAGCMFGGGRFWGYYPGKLWSMFICKVLLLPVRVEGREHLQEGQSYVFVANHQGAFDIFLIYGYLGRNFKWMMKRGLRKIPFVGYACEKAGQVFVDKRNAKSTQHTLESARRTLQNGMSLTVFPEGARTFTGHMALFRRGAFALAHDLGLPVVPMTIDGSFDVLPRMRGVGFVAWHPLRLTIHPPLDASDLKEVMDMSWNTIMAALPDHHKGYVANADQ
ncbi:MAG: 1-acyl-sn-glycerol-3-phosphate acyltransferase [Bacteroidaceae bacterium]|nr:1-acyl-sn-glycerol-3-phosphate acyltransferase [Bacteroidaceae bacterium]